MARDRLVGLRWGGGNRLDLSHASVPRVKLYEADDELLVSLCIGDSWSDPVVGIDVYVTGRFGAWLNDRLWAHRTRKRARRAGP